MLRTASLSAVGRDVGAVARSLAAQAAAFRPSALMWLTDGADARALAEAMADSAPASVGGISRGGLIGGGSDWPCSSEETRGVALAIGLPDTLPGVLPFHSEPDGLPHFPDPSAWTKLAAATPETSPHLLLLAAPPKMSSFPLERWVSMIDTALPWARKVGGLTVGDGRLYVGNTEHDGGVVGLALQGVDMEAHSFQGAIPFGPSCAITAHDGTVVTELDGRSVGDTLGEALETFQQENGPSSGVNVMVGVSVPARAAAASPHGTPQVGGADHEYVVRSLLGYSREHSILAVGASPTLLEAPGARLRLHSFSAATARAEMQARAIAAMGGLQDGMLGGGLMVSCLGRGESLYGEQGVEIRMLRNTLGSQLALAGFKAGGEIGPVGSRTYVHTFTTTVGLLRART